MKRILTVCSVIFILCALLASSPAQAANPAAPDANCRSTGTGGNWSTMTWSCGHTPTQSDDVVIEVNDTVYVDVDAHVLGVTVEGYGNLYLNAGKSITTHGSYFTMDGLFSAGTGSMKFVDYSSGPVCVWGTQASTFNNVETSVEIDFQCGANRATVQGVLLIGPGGSVSDPPNYADGSTLQYYRNSSTNVGYEWGTGTSGAGVPYHVQISNNTPLATTDTSTRTVRGNLTIDGGSSLTLGTTSGLALKGNWTNNGSFTANSSTVAFTGLSHTIGGSQATTFYNLTIDGPDGDTPTVVNIGVEPFINGALVLDRTDDGKDAATANSIKLVQTLAVNDAEQKFLELTNSSGNTTKLDGVYVDTRADDSNLGNVTVEMTLRRYDTSSFDLDSCFGETAYNHSMRCYKLTSTAWPTGAKAKLTFWVPPAELGYLLPAYTLMVFHWMEENPAEPHTDFYWVSLDTPGVSGTNPYGVYGTTTSFSEFIVSDNNPTAVELVDLSARPASVPLAAPILLGAAAFLTGGILAFRKLRQR